MDLNKFQCVGGKQAIGIRSCNCIGPQGGAPVCPCAMAHVKVENGRYIQRIDLGPAPSQAAPAAASTKESDHG